MKSIAQYIDHTNLNAIATPSDIKRLCDQAISNQFYAICIHDYHVSLAKKILLNTSIKIATVIGFPLGANTTASKVFEAKNAINNGADEIDMVLNIGALKAGDFDQVLNDISSVKKSIGSAILKVIFENCYLTPFEIEKACLLSIEAGADYIKTSTGFGASGATLDDIKLMKKTVGNLISIKASGGIKTKEMALSYIDLGVTRIGTSSGINIIK